ncbi:MAG: glutaredoxin family protein [bacterium]|nr:glutaredoxin family protein [bacterium]
MNEIIMYGADWCPDCRRAKAFLNENGVTYEFRDIDVGEESVRKVETINKGKRIIPTFEILGKTYTNPDNARLACTQGLNPQGRYVEKLPSIANIKTFMNKRTLEFTADDKGLFKALKVYGTGADAPTCENREKIVRSKKNPPLTVDKKLNLRHYYKEKEI